MNLLGIDTSSENLSLSIMKEDKVLFNLNRRIRFGASKLVQHIEKYLKKLTLDLKQIDAFVLGAGPGSFTGLRISFSVVKALSLSLDKPVIRMGSFLACACPFNDKYKKIAVISDARRNLIYATSFIASKGKVKKEGKEKLVEAQEFVHKRKDYFFLTYDDNIRERVKKIYPTIDIYPKNFYPQAKYLLLLAKEQFLKKEFTPISKLEPLYLHPKTCQIRIR